jgi:hypothetical protein
LPFATTMAISFNLARRSAIRRIFLHRTEVDGLIRPLYNPATMRLY